MFICTLKLRFWFTLFYIAFYSIRTRMFGKSKFFLFPSVVLVFYFLLYFYYFIKINQNTLVVPPYIFNFYKPQNRIFSLKIQCNASFNLDKTFTIKNKTKLHEKQHLQLSHLISFPIVHLNTQINNKKNDKTAS